MAASRDGDLGPLVAAVAYGSGVSLLPPLPSSLGPRGPMHVSSCGLAGPRPSGCVSDALRRSARQVRPAQNKINKQDE